MHSRTSKYHSVSYFRRLVVDLMHFSAKVPSATIERRMNLARLIEAEAVRIVIEIARAVAEAHRRGIIHRDLKLSNVMIDDRGEPVVMNFGLARRVAGDSAL